MIFVEERSYWNYALQLHQTNDLDWLNNQVKVCVYQTKALFNLVIRQTKFGFHVLEPLDMEENSETENMSPRDVGRAKDVLNPARKLHFES